MLDQQALDDAVAKAIAPLAQKVEDLEATIAYLRGDLSPLCDLTAQFVRQQLELDRKAIEGPSRRRFWQRRDSNALEPAS